MQINSISTFKGLIRANNGYGKTTAINTDKIIWMDGIYTNDARIFHDDKCDLKVEPINRYSTCIYFDNKTKISIPHKINVIEAYKKVVNDKTAVVNIADNA